MRPRRTEPGSRLVVLGYHNIESTWRFPVRGDGRRRFARQMGALQRVTNIIPLDDALHAIRAGRPLPPRAVAVTMDDGYRDNLTGAVPILIRLAIPATIYLVPGFLSRAAGAWWEELAWALDHARARSLEFAGREFDLTCPDARWVALKELEADLKAIDHASRGEAVEDIVKSLDPFGRYRDEDLFLDWDGALDLVRAGVSIGSHTMEHAILAREPEEHQAADLRESRSALERGLGVGVHTLAYPNGTRSDYDEATVRAAGAAGYSHAVTTWGGAVDAATPAYEISRRMVGVDDPLPRFLVGVLRQFRA